MSRRPPRSTRTDTLCPNTTLYRSETRTRYTAEAMTQIFTEVVIAPDADEEARAVFAKKKNLRLLLTGDLPDPARPGFALKSIAGGYLVQSRDNGRIGRDDLKVVTTRADRKSTRLNSSH